MPSVTVSRRHPSQPVMCLINQHAPCRLCLHVRRGCFVQRHEEQTDSLERGCELDDFGRNAADQWAHWRLVAMRRTTPSLTFLQDTITHYLLLWVVDVVSVGWRVVSRSQMARASAVKRVMDHGVILPKDARVYHQFDYVKSSEIVAQNALRQPSHVEITAQSPCQRLQQTLLSILNQ